jgi:hypothetical protein
MGSYFYSINVSFSCNIFYRKVEEKNIMVILKQLWEILGYVIGGVLGLLCLPFYALFVYLRKK